ncbi:MerR family transcriptional regulator [Streptosporangium sp. NBC_01755]|uniref:helix-turn-helix domain-containing protein n=1 Tax=Streptosporangium sp. NBC_01755 TaxID=2975949 RepID=UPI002DD8ADF4|nr:MerR family transcriptional regulator [Streptosporangium sp. NBC_01755]WSC98637.1 MerR family transcriptional regulator [Streptosporangium sp. NBC_01755]
MNDRDRLLTIGQLADRTGLSVRTIRFWSDIGVIPPTCRSAGGFRLYDMEAVARLDLVRTLRELGLDLDTVRQVLTRQCTVADVARAYVRALDTQIRSLHLRRAVLRSIAQQESTTEEMMLMHKLIRLSAQERQRMIDDFVDRTFDGIDPQSPGAHIATSMRQIPAELPDDPSPEQVEAWLELAELVGDAGFQERVRQMAVAGATPGDESGPQPYDPALVLEHAGRAVAAGISPESAEGRAILDQIVDPALPAGDRARVADHVETFTDRRVERYWQLVGVLNGRPPFPPRVPAFEWFIAALRVS